MKKLLDFAISNGVRADDIIKIKMTGAGKKWNRRSAGYKCDK